MNETQASSTNEHVEAMSEFYDTTNFHNFHNNPAENQVRYISTVFLSHKNERWDELRLRVKKFHCSQQHPHRVC